VQSASAQATFAAAKVVTRLRRLPIALTEFVLRSAIAIRHAAAIFRVVLPVSVRDIGFVEVVVLVDVDVDIAAPPVAAAPRCPAPTAPRAPPPPPPPGETPKGGGWQKPQKGGEGGGGGGENPPRRKPPSADKSARTPHRAWRAR